MPSGLIESGRSLDTCPMTYVVTRLCRDCLDTACTAVCPVSCIYRYVGDDSEKYPNQLYIHPGECVDCNACAVSYTHLTLPTKA